ncbi:protein involved in defense response [Arthrobacter sp. Hiyo4]|nr:protein involved in defense response [Arthrobacter sp. Hiyo4]
MLTVSHDAFSVESDLAAGRLTCPGCAGVLRPWSWARARFIRHDVGEACIPICLRPRRGRCQRRSVTHVLLGVDLAARRADTAAVIAAAVEAKAAGGSGHRVIAAWLGRPVSTVRAWLPPLAVLAALDQRISTRFAITGMDPVNTADYIRHHLKFAGRSDTLFSDDAVTAIHHGSRGYPRAVNNLAVSALIATYASGKAIVDLSAAQSAITENSE